MLKMTIRSFLIASVALIGSAQAADFKPSIVPAPIVTPAFSWTGFYVGVTAGYGEGEFPTDADDRAAAVLGNPAISFTDDISDAEGLFGGIVAGYNYQINQFVIGVEGELLLSEIEDKFNIAGAVPGEASLNYLGLITARAGFAPLERVLLYVEGGYAFGEAEVDADLIAVAAPTGDVSDSNIHHGFTLGGGIEVAVMDNVSVRAEYSYVDLGVEVFDLGPVTDVDAEFEGNLFKAGVNFLF
ncbi:MAG: outer membrane protein [Pseudomonadota bacterium]